jgi:hypothetical protein
MLQAIEQYFLYATSFAINTLLAVILGIVWITVPSHRKRALWALIAIISILPLGLDMGIILRAIGSFCGVRYDLYLFNLERNFGEPSFLVGQIAATCLWLYNLFMVTYNLFFTSIILTLSALLWLRSERKAVIAARTFLLNLVASVGFYLILPASGPRYAFHQFPYLPKGPVSVHPLPLTAFPNCVPSVHMSNALLVLWFLRNWWWGRILGIAFVALTGLSTLGIGEHYFIDLLCAFPYAAWIIWMARDTSLASNVSEYASSNTASEV